MHLVQRICQEAARLLHEKGWVQKAGLGPDGSICVAQALGQAHYQAICDCGLEGTYLKDLLFRHVCVVLNEINGKRKKKNGESERLSIVTWNDAAGRTKQEVLALLEKAATTPVKEVG